MTEISATTELLPAGPEIASVAARLLFLTMGPLAEYWMGVGNQSIAEAILLALYRRPNNLFSHRFGTCARVDGEAVGIELSYPARTMRRLEPTTLWQFLQVAGVGTTIRMVMRSYPLQGITEAGSDEYFLAHLGVLPDHEGRGLGRQLLQLAEQKCRNAGLTKITLTVDAENERAIRLYTRAGFVVTSSMEFESLKRRFGYHGYHHMLKDLH